MMPTISHAIVVKFVACTRKKPNRWLVSAATDKKYYSCGQFYDGDTNRDRCLAVKDFCKLMGWKTNVVGGMLPGGDMVYVQRN